MPLHDAIVFVGQEKPFFGDECVVIEARYYDPQVGRFISEDPIGFGGGDVNLYAYVSNNPILFIDPWGLCGTSPSGSGAGFVKHLLEDKLPSWLHDNRSDADRESAHQAYNKDIADRLSEVWDVTKIVTYPERTIFWAPVHTYEKIQGEYPNDSYFDPWHHHDTHE